MYLLIQLLIVLLMTRKPNANIMREDELRRIVNPCLRLDDVCILRSWWGLRPSNFSLDPWEIVCDGTNFPQLIVQRLVPFLINDDEVGDHDFASPALTRSRYVTPCPVHILAKLQSLAELGEMTRQVANLYPEDSWTIVLDDEPGKVLSHFACKL